MRSALTAVVSVFLLAVAPAALGESTNDESPEGQGGVVALLIQADSPTSELHLRSDALLASGWERVTVPVEGSVDETIRALERDLGTRVFVDVAYPLLGGQDEPLFSNQWALENTGQAGGVPDADIDVTEAWSVSTGSGAVVAVIDSGVDDGHPDLENQIWRNTDEVVNGVDDDGNGFIDDVNGWDFHSNDNHPGPSGSSFVEAHATFVAGIIAAEVNGLGIAGVAPDSRVMNLRACNGGSCLTSSTIAAMKYAVDNGADIINLSFGAKFQSIDLESPLAQAIEYARRHDVLVVTAAGNTAPDELAPGDFILPAEYPHSNNIAVAGTTREDQVGEQSYYGENIDIAAPGYEIFSTAIPSFAVGSGTSYAAPHVAGVAALLRSLDDDVSHVELAARILGSVDTPEDVVGKVESGRLNAARAVPLFFDILGSTFEGDIEWAAATGVTKGCDPPANTLFCPDDAITRGQMAAFIKRFLVLPPAATDHFSDDNGSTFEDDINRLADAGITRGCNPPANDHYCADELVTREQMAAFLVRALDLTEDTHPGFADVSVLNTFRADIEKLATAGITLGCNPPDNTRFCPGEDVTRGETVAFLHRADD